VGAGGWNNRPKFCAAGAAAGTDPGSTCPAPPGAAGSRADSVSRGGVTDFLTDLRGARLATFRAGAAVMSAGADVTSAGASVATTRPSTGVCCGALAFLVALRGARLAAAFLTGAGDSAGTSGAVPALKRLSSFDAIWGVFPSSTWQRPHPGLLASSPMVRDWVRLPRWMRAGRKSYRYIVGGSRCLARHRLRCRRRSGRQPMDRPPSRLQSSAAPAPAESPGVVSAA